MPMTAENVKRIVIACLEEYGLVAPTLPTIVWMAKIDEMLVAKPFVPFRVRSGTTDFEIHSSDQARFNHHGTFEVRNQGDGKVSLCFVITLVEPL
jgi:hypothetical protein